jgi:hypothetical protein
MGIGKSIEQLIRLLRCSAAVRLQGVEGHGGGRLGGDVTQRELQASVAGIALASQGPQA